MRRRSAGTLAMGMACDVLPSLPESPLGRVRRGSHAPAHSTIFPRQLLRRLHEEAGLHPGMPLSLSPFERSRLERLLTRFCEGSGEGGPASRSRLRYRFQDEAVTLYQARDGEERPVVRFVREPASKRWAAFIPDGLGGWRAYPALSPSEDLELLLESVNGPPSAIFWT